MRLNPTSGQANAHAHVEVRPVSWLVLACAAFWGVLAVIAVTVLTHG